LKSTAYGKKKARLFLTGNLLMRSNSPFDDILCPFQYLSYGVETGSRVLKVLKEMPIFFPELDISV
jgi:hypothetical protein